jgi:hypothetical protein
MCGCDYAEQPSVHRSKMTVARKVHRCTECGANIQPGETYERVFGVWDGRADTYKTCALCLDLRSFVQEHNECFCIVYGGLQDEIYDTHDHGAPPAYRWGLGRRLVRIRRNRKATRAAA